MSRSAAATTLFQEIPPAKLGPELREIGWDSIFDQCSLDELDEVKFALKVMQYTLEDVAERKCRGLETVPDAVQRLLSGQYAQASQRSLIKDDTLPYVLTIAPHVKSSQRLKLNVRQIMGCFSFTQSLGWAEGWQPLQNGARQHLARLGQELDFLYQRAGLREKLGHYGVIATTAVSDNNHHGNTSTSISNPQAQDDDSRTSSATSQSLWLQQLIPTQFCSRTICENAPDLASSVNLECIYTHFLRMLATALDKAFQDKVKRVLAQHDIKFVHYSGGIKSFERMLMKARSEADYANRPMPRPSYNNDIVRCLITFETVGDMQRGIELLKTLFHDGYNKFENGMAWSDEEAQARHHLRLILATGRFVVDSMPTIGHCRSDVAVQQLWREYVATQKVPSFVGRSTWKDYFQQAAAWINTLPDDAPLWMNCEVQMLLRPYTEARRGMHELYKINRATSYVSLYADYASLQEQEALRRQYVQDGDSVVKEACRDGKVEALRRLLLSEEGGTAMTSTTALNAAFLIACDYAQDGCVQELVARVDAQTLSKGLLRCVHPKSDFSLTVQDQGRAHIVQTLLAQGAVVEVTDDSLSINAALVWASENGFTGCVEQLLSAKAEVDSAVQRMSALWRATFDGQVDCVRLLLKAKAEVDKVKSATGASPTFMAAQNGHSETLRLLVKAKADVHLAKGNGVTPLMKAAQSGHVGAVQLLIRAKASTTVNHHANNGTTAAVRAAGNGHVQVLQLLVRAKASVNLRTSRHGATPLFLAAEGGHVGALQYLLSAKANVDTAANDGEAPIHTAAAHGQTATLRLLLDAKANTKCRYQGRTAEGWATKNKHSDVLKLLRQWKTQTKHQ